MKRFLKENLIYILLILLFSLILIFWAQIMRAEFRVVANFNNLETVSDRVRCAESLGWQVDTASETKRQLYIDQTPTPDFLEYNEFQRMCGFDLMPYLGKGVTVYTYRILNFPSQTPVNAFLNLIFYKNQMIGGDCMVDEYDDLYLPVKLPKLDTYITGAE